MPESYDEKLQRIKKELAAEKAKDDQGTNHIPRAYVPKIPLGHGEQDIYKKKK